MCSEPISEDGCRLGRSRPDSAAQMARLAPITRDGCRLGHAADKNADETAQTTPISEDGCRLGHFRPDSAAKVARLAPISEDVPDDLHLAEGTTRDRRYRLPKLPLPSRRTEGVSARANASAPATGTLCSILHNYPVLQHAAHIRKEPPCR